jgi:hypothetical protein
VASSPTKLPERKVQAEVAFKLTYSTMFDPPEELHRRRDGAGGGQEPHGVDRGSAGDRREQSQTLVE